MASFWTVKTDKESVSDGGGQFIIDSGMYDVTIKNCVVRRSEPDSGKKGEWIDLIVDYQGTCQTIYRAINMRNNDGSAGFGEKMFNKLCIICGAGGGVDISTVRKSVCTNQKEGSYEEVDVIEEVEDCPVTLRMAKRYSRYEGEVRRNVDLKNVFRTTDKATASEITQGGEKGKQYNIEMKTCHETIYKDDVTEEEAKEYEEARRTGTKPAASSGAKRRFGSFGSEDTQTDEIPF